MRRLTFYNVPKPFVTEIYTKNEAEKKRVVREIMTDDDTHQQKRKSVRDQLTSFTRLDVSAEHNCT
jgi:hypothetical protein